MSKYTTTVQDLVNKYYSRDELVSWFCSYNIADYLRDDELELFNSDKNRWTKEKLANKIIDHYYMREIGFETPELFKHYVKITMKEIMERYVPLIYSKLLEFNPLVNVDYVEKYQSNRESVSNTESNSNGLSLNSDTPQHRVKKQDILNGNYVSSTLGNESQDNTNSNNNANETYSRSFKGNSGSLTTAQRLIQDYRNIIIAVDEEIILELNSLFMSIY